MNEAAGLEEIADELYGLAPGAFTATRNARAAEARRAGRRDLASELKKLRKPTGGAWLVNLLARERREEVEGFLALGPAMEQAQSELAGDRLRRLAEERHTTIRHLSVEARLVAAARGLRVTDAIEAELQATLEAGLADRTMAQRIRTGRLTAPLRYSGLGTGIPASGRRAGDRRSSRPANTPSKPSQNRDRSAAANALAIEAARREAERAKDELASADEEVQAAEATLRTARQKASAARRRARRGEQALRRAEEAAGDAGAQRR